MIIFIHFPPVLNFIRYLKCNKTKKKQYQNHKKPLIRSKTPQNKKVINNRPF